MARQIFKYPLSVAGSQTCQLPRGAELLSVQQQHGELQLWAMVDGARGVESVEILVYGTGQELPDDLTRADYVGTVQMLGGIFVWHVFRRVVA
jgi:hypothetical protein